MHKQTIGDRPQLKILLLGKDGQVGRELQRSLAPLGNITAWGRETADLSNPERLRQLVLAEKPHIIVNAAAYTAVDKAESEPELAHTINADAPAALAIAAKDLGALLIHYSTDYVFNGEGHTPWSEDSPTGPLNVYGKSKLAGEEAIKNSGCKYLIFRTSWVYAKEGANFAKTMLRLACERDTLSVIDDQMGAPTDAAWLANMTAQIIISQGPTPNGIYHAVCAGKTSWYGYASYLIGKALEMGFPIKVAPEAIKAVSSEAFPTAARRPKNSTLNHAKLAAIFDMTPPPWQAGIDQLLRTLKP